MDIDKRIIEILDIISKDNYQALLVGGFVRNKLLNISSGDIDISTNRNLADLELLFSEYEYIYYKGLLSSIKIKYKDISAEVSQFREEIYSDDYQELKYVFVSEFKDDTKRRDFRINALGLDKDNNLYDYHNGLIDLENKILRSIGNPNIRYQEDPIRVMRALRLSSSLNLTINKADKAAILKYYPLSLKLNINYELKKILKGNNFKYVYDNFKEIFKSISSNKFKYVDNKNIDSNLKLLVYLYFLMDLDLDNDIYTYLTFSKKELKFVKSIESIVALLKVKQNSNYLHALIIKGKPDLIKNIISTFENLDYLDKDNLDNLNKLLKKHLSITDLKINESDFSSNLNKKAIYTYLNDILIKVVLKDLDNERDILLQYLSENNLGN